MKNIIVILIVISGVLMSMKDKKETPKCDVVEIQAEYLHLNDLLLAKKGQDLAPPDTILFIRYNQLKDELRKGGVLPQVAECPQIHWECICSIYHMGICQCNELNTFFCNTLHNGYCRYCDCAIRTRIQGCTCGLVE